MENEKRSMLKTIALSVKDTFLAMPLITTVTFLLQMLSAGISVALVSFTARLIDAAGQVEEGYDKLILYALMIVGCYFINILFHFILW